MSKIKIYELAKELDKPSKELVEFLNKKDVEAKGRCRKSRRGKI